MSFNDQFDIEIKEIDEDNLILRCKAEKDFYNEINAIHGGVIMTLAVIMLMTVHAFYISRNTIHQ